MCDTTKMVSMSSVDIGGAPKGMNTSGLNIGLMIRRIPPAINPKTPQIVFKAPPITGSAVSFLSPGSIFIT